MKLSKAQNELLQAIKDGAKVEGYNLRSRFVMNGGTKQAKVIRNKTILALIDNGILSVSTKMVGVCEVEVFTAK